MKKIYYLLGITICTIICLSLEGCGKTEYLQYQNRIWIMDSKVNGEVSEELFSFRITEIQDEGIIGKCFLGEGNSLINSYFDRCGSGEQLGEFSGKIIDGIAECNFRDNYGNEGSLFIKEWKEDSIMVSLEYKNEGGEDKDIKDGIYFFSACEISEVMNFDVRDNNIWNFNMPSWGNVELVCGQLNNKENNIYYPLAYLTDSKGKILYQFDLGDIPGTKISDVMIDDINEDGMEDVRLTICYDLAGDQGYRNMKKTINWDFYQGDGGRFYTGKEDQDYSKYLDRIWFVKIEEKPLTTPFAFYFTEIEENNITGKIDLGGWISMDKNWNESVNVTANISGKIVNGIGFCDFESESGNRGKLIVSGWEGDQLIVNLRKIEGDFNSVDDGFYLCTSHNIADLRDVFVVDQYTFETNLDSWGDIWITTVQTNIDEDGNFYSDVYMTTEEGDILNKFNLGNYPNMKVKNIVIEDMDGDGLKDIAITTVFEDCEIVNEDDKCAIKWISYQTETGNFILLEQIDLGKNLPIEDEYNWKQ